MGKRNTPPRSPALRPGATAPPAPDPAPSAERLPLAESPVIPEVPPAEDPVVPAVQEPEAPGSEDRGPEPEVDQSILAPLRPGRYRVRNLFQGFRERDLHEGDVIECDEDEAAPYTGKDGVLERLEDEA